MAERESAPLMRAMQRFADHKSEMPSTLNAALQPGAGRTIPGTGGDGDHVLAQGDDSGRESSRATGPGGAADGSEPLPAGFADGNNDGAARERILTLAGASAEGAVHAGRKGGS